MPAKYCTKFDINHEELTVIETALRNEASRISLERLSKLGSETPLASPELDNLDSQISDIQAALGKLFNQKVWYAPESYVPRG